MVMVSRFTAAIFASMFAVALADLTGLSIVSPGTNVWWVAKSANNIVWTCQTAPVQNFTVLIANSNPSILTAPEAIIAIQTNADCSKTITQDQANQAPGTGYTILFANIFNQSDVYATSQPFEIKALGSPYPASSATPTIAGTATGSGTATGASSSSSSTGSSKGAASGLTYPIGFGVAAAAAVLGLLTA